MATQRARAFSASVLENQVGPGSNLPGKQLANQPGKQILNKLGVGPTRGRNALGDVTNARHNSVDTNNGPAKDLKQAKPVKPSARSGSKEALKEPEAQKNVEEIMETSTMEDAEMDEQVVEEIEDVDKDDAKNPQLVVEYVQDIYCYLRQLEAEQKVQPEYLAKNTTILPKMRAVLIDWLVGVHLQFHLLQETLYTTVAILDRFLQVEVDSIPRNKLQLVGVAAMLVASKYEEIYAPEIKDFVYITDRAYTEKEIIRMELRILHTLEFNLGRPLPLHFLRRASKAGGVEAATHTLAKYVMELSLGCYSMCSTPPSTLAAAALALSSRLLEPGTSIQTVWTRTLVHYTKYSLKEIHPIVVKLAEILVAAPSAKLSTVYQKYCNKKFMKIARIPVLDEPLLKSLAAGELK